MAQGKSGTGPYGSFEKARNMHQLPVRIHKNDYALLRQWLDKDGMKFQHFVLAVVESYLQRDQALVKLVEDWKKINLIRFKDVDRFDFSNREKRKILDELSEEFDDIGKDNDDDD